MVERKVGGAVLEYEGGRAWVPMIFGEPEDDLVLEATSLEALGYQVDTIYETAQTRRIADGLSGFTV